MNMLAQQQVSHAIGIVLSTCLRFSRLSREGLAHQAGLDRTYPSLVERQRDNMNSEPRLRRCRLRQRQRRLLQC